jgi:N-acyl-D-amino-acid deacylase
LLQHRGGWDRDKSFDAMFQSVKFAKKLGVDAPAGPATIIKAMLSEKLDFAPGERYAYSNFGYCLLGRVIEKLTGDEYEQAVKKAVLAPLGISSMRLGKTRLADRAEGEVRYYQPSQGRSVFESDLRQPVPVPYGAWYLEAMDAHGAWLASAEDLAKFAAAFDDADHCPILSAKSIELMHERPEGAAGYEEDGAKKDSFYSLGWLNRVTTGDKLNHWHTGSLDGTATILIRRADGRNLIALLNTRASPSSAHLGRAVDELLHRAANAVKKWPQRE